MLVVLFLADAVYSQFSPNMGEGVTTTDTAPITASDQADLNG